LGYWSKKIRGTIRHFGRWGRTRDGKLMRVEGDGWKEALELYKAQADDLHAGREPRTATDAMTVKDLGEKFMMAKYRKLAAGELGRRMFEEYRETCQLLADTFGKTRLVDDLAGDDFETLRAKMAERWGPVRLGNAITRIRSVFKYGLDNALLKASPRFGSEFKKPGKAVLRKHRAVNGEKMLEAYQLRRMLAALNGRKVATGRIDETNGKPQTIKLPLNPPLRAMVLLGLNCGFGNHDVATLPMAAIDLNGQWIDFPRPKTGIARRCPLWPETVIAIREAISARPRPQSASDEQIVFLQPSGRRWVRETEKSRTDNISVCLSIVMKKLGIHRDGLNFYSLRHIFRTVADGARDPVAIDLIMGHTDPSMGGHYRERVEDARLIAVAEHVRQWLFVETPEKPARNLPVVCDPVNAAADREQVSTMQTRPTLRLFAG
jgi:integrase